MMVRDTVAVCVSPPVPFTLTRYVPAGVDDPTMSVMVEDPEPGAAIGAGLNVAVVAVGSPDGLRLRAIAELKPPETVVAIVLVPLAPCAADIDVGEAAMLNAGAVTVRDTVAVCVTAPAVPLTVTV